MQAKSRAERTYGIDSKHEEQAESNSQAGQMGTLDTILIGILQSISISSA